MASHNVKKLRIGDVAEQLEVKEFVIRFWEREFKIKAKRSAGGQRFYTKQQVALLLQIKDLLYAKEYTIAGAKKYLETHKEPVSKKMLVTAAKLDMSNQPSDAAADLVNAIESMALQQLTQVRDKLVKLKELL